MSSSKEKLQKEIKNLEAEVERQRPFKENSAILQNKYYATCDLLYEKRDLLNMMIGEEFEESKRTIRSLSKENRKSEQAFCESFEQGLKLVEAGNQLELGSDDKDEEFQRALEESMKFFNPASNRCGKSKTPSPRDQPGTSKEYDFTNVSPRDFVFKRVNDIWRLQTCRKFSLTNVQWPDLSGVLSDDVVQLSRYGPAPTLTTGADLVHSSKNSELSIIGDGHCFFRCLSLEITGTQKNHERIRSLIEQHIKKYGLPGPMADMSVEKYYSSYKDNNYAQEGEIVTAMIIFNINLLIWKRIQFKTKEWEEKYAWTSPFAFDKNKKTIYMVVEGVFEGDKKNSLVSENHFQLVLNVT
uniref:OTU domain-containing protein n=1 Tax=viral metagenome TaxID=1070528 RepID=A0A6C0JUW7_9ZZZZ